MLGTAILSNSRQQLKKNCNERVRYYKHKKIIHHIVVLCGTKAEHFWLPTFDLKMNWAHILWRICLNGWTFASIQTNHTVSIGCSTCFCSMQSDLTWSWDTQASCAKYAINTTRINNLKLMTIMHRSWRHKCTKHDARECYSKQSKIIIKNLMNAWDIISTKQ